MTNDEKGNHNYWGKRKIHIPTTSVWMSASEIAALFGVFSGKAYIHIKLIFKKGLQSNRTLSFKGGVVDLYNIEMITMLSFRFSSLEAKNFRKWIIRRLTKKKKITPPLLVCYNKNDWYS